MRVHRRKSVDPMVRSAGGMTGIVRAQAEAYATAAAGLPHSTKKLFEAEHFAVGGCVGAGGGEIVESALGRFDDVL